MDIVKRRRVRGGWDVTVSGREHPVFVPDERVAGRTGPEAMQVLVELLEDDPWATILNAPIAAPVANKAMLGDRMVERYDRWLRWKNTHAEAVARSIGAAKITALKNRMDATWAAYLSALNDWLAAP